LLEAFAVGKKLRNAVAKLQPFLSGEALIAHFPLLASSM
jgi:hypothetical protein